MTKLNGFLRITFNISFILLFTINVYFQSDDESKNILQPPLKGLVAVHHPDLDGVEKDVREQIISFQESLRKATKTKPISREQLGKEYGTMGEIYHAYSLLKPAEESYLNAYRLAPRNFKWQYLLGKLSFEQNKIYDAIDYFNRSQKLSPNYLPVYVNLGNAHLELDLLLVAKAHFETALKISPKNPAALYGLGQIAYSDRDFASAVKYFEQVLQILPAANRVHYSLALAYRGLKNIEKAKFHIAKQGTVGVRAADPVYDGLEQLKKGVRLSLLRGKQAFEAKRFVDAQIEYQKVLNVEPKNITALVNLGSTYVQLGNGSEAMRQFEKALAVEPKNTNARYNLAVLLTLQKKHFQAIGHLKEILRLNENDMEARFLLAKELRNANLLNESLSEFTKVLAANPDNEEVILEGIELLTKKGDYKYARDILTTSNVKFPERGQTAATLAYILATAPEKELRDGKKAMELASKVFNATKQIHHGVIVALAYAELGQCENATKLTQKLLDAATKAKNQNWISKLKTELSRFQNKKPCN